MRADQLVADGDFAGARIWKRISASIEFLAGEKGGWNCSLMCFLSGPLRRSCLIETAVPAVGWAGRFAESKARLSEDFQKVSE